MHDQASTALGSQDRRNQGHVVSLGRPRQNVPTVGWQSIEKALRFAAEKMRLSDRCAKLDRPVEYVRNVLRNFVGNLVRHNVL
jgi:hypothetical protein